MQNRRRLGLAASVVVVIAAAATLAGCAAFGTKADKFGMALKGISATMTSYDDSGQQIDKVHGASFAVTRDTTFDTTDENGKTIKEGSVILITLGGKRISHVGSSLILAQDGIVDLTPQMQSTKLSFSNADPGMPWLNNFIRNTTDLWRGKARTILVRSQSGAPVAVFAGDSVTSDSTSVPQSTWFRVDGKTLFVYRADYTVYDTALLVQ